MGFMRFATKVKGLFNSPEDAANKEEAAKSKSQVSHNKAKKELLSSSTDSDESSPVPDMLRLQNSDDGQHSDEEDNIYSNI
jgi:hypothetical protein